MQGTLTFTRPDHVVPDDERPGLLRALPARADDGGDPHTIQLHDLAQPGSVEAGLDAAGFETVDLSGNAALQAALAQVLEMDRLTDQTAEAIRHSLDGATLGLGDGTSLRIDHVVEDGLFHRRSGPAGLDVNPGGIDGINGHGGAEFVHGDQDVFGTPLRQLMAGAAPEMFRHVSPDGRNDTATTMLLNLWIPLHAPVQPLALMDRRTLDASRHQLRYGLPVDGFLERDDDAAVNDIWNFLHHDDQRWYFRSDMGPDQGYVFDTLGTAHGAAVLPGETTLAALCVELQRRLEPQQRTDEPDEVPTPAPDDAPPAIRQAAQRMSELLRERSGPTGDTAEWCDRARAEVDAVIRRSVEMRLVATLIAP